MDLNKVRSNANELLNKFGKDLEKVKIDSISVKSSSVLRKEEKGESCDEDFKTIMFKNAPHKDEMSLLLEKGSWN